MIVILGCGSSKHDKGMPAIDLYKGGNFSLRRSLARDLVDDRRIFILSAKFGLIRSSQVIQPYDLRLGDEGSVTKQRVASQARRLRISNYPAIFLGGSDYYDLCREAFVRVESILPKAIIHRQHLFMARLRERLENGIE